MSRSDWCLLAISAARGAPLTPVQLQKALFIMGDELDLVESFGRAWYSFKPYNYGPFDHYVYRDAEDLAARGHVSVSSQGRTRVYAPTAAGMAQAEHLAATLPDRTRAYMYDLVATIRSMSFSDLVRAVYKRYPEMRARSVFVD